MKLHIDIETYSSTDLTKAGLYKYVEDPSFEILLIAYALDDKPVEIVEGVDFLPLWVKSALLDPNIEKHAYNATFERVSLSKGLVVKLPIDQWHCTMVHGLMAGYPAGLEMLGKAMGLADKLQKDTAGKNLIKYFSMPCKATKINGGRTRNLPHHVTEKWEAFKQYCIQDVESERAISKRLTQDYKITDAERQMYILDQDINDRGVALNPKLASNAVDLNLKLGQELTTRAKQLTGLENPNSVAQLKKWLEIHEGLEIPSLNKETLETLSDSIKTDIGNELISIRKELSKTSVKKYITMGTCLGDDGRVRGLLQFYGANRTGRWAGRLIQVQNLPQNKMPDLDFARNLVLNSDFDGLNILYPSVSNVLSQLIRTAFIAKEGYKFIVSDFAAIEARVIAWLSGEVWRLDVFNTHGKIYEASASHMFKVPLEDISSDLRQKGKVAELALGYQGSVGALVSMGALKMGLLEDELQDIVDKWRSSNRKITTLWKDIEAVALECVEKKTVATYKNIKFLYTSGNMYIELPSGRKLSYIATKLDTGKKFGNKIITYRGMNQTTKQWERIETYGGKLVENIVQAIARDCLATAMLRLKKAGFNIVMHVHDEVVIEECLGSANALEAINGIMKMPMPWAEGLPLKGESFETQYYLKD